uniref:Ribonuclease H-like domain-containing protein n=1 Tax=Tanacetum cinerariifolium TaxID=118510 RepID=A0A6L2MI89_TANCI|nr:ribonuclease H-like domain-containing protein [Tanacetum cinerariifolium]
MQKNTTFKNSNVNQRINIVGGKKFNTARPKAVVNAVKENNSNVVKVSACWVWKPKQKVLDHVSKHNNALITQKKFNYVDAQSRSKVPRKNNMYSVDLKNIVPKGGLTCLFAKATFDESKLWYSVTILNTIDHLGNFDGKTDEGFFVRYSLNSKAFRVLNSRTKIVEKNLHIRFSESTPNVVGSGPEWLFDIDALTRTMNYEPIVAGTQSNGFADPKNSNDDGSKPSIDDGKKVDEDPRKEKECNDQEKEDNVNNTNNVNTEDVSTFEFSKNDKDDSAVASMNNLDTTIQVSPIPTTRIYKDHSFDQVIGDVHSATQTRKMSKNLEEHGFCKKRIVVANSKTEAKYVAASSCYGQVLWIQNQLLDYRKPKRKDTPVPQPSSPTDSVADEAIHKELGDSLVRAATTASSLEAEQDSGGGPRCQKTMRDTIAQTRFENVSKHSNDSVMVGLSARVESSRDEESLGEDSSKQRRRIDAIDADEVVTLFNDANKEMFDADDLGGEDVFVAWKNKNVVEEVVNAAQVSIAATTVTITTEEITLAQTLEALKTLKLKVKGIVFQDPGKSTTTTTNSSQQSQDKGKEIMIEEPVKPKKKDQIRLDEEAAKKKHFAAKKAEEKRNKPPTKAQQRKIMCTYLKNMEGYKLKDLKLKEFDSIQEMFDKAFKRVNTYEDFRTKLVEGKEKRAGTKLEQEITKKQKVEDDKEEDLKDLYKLVKARYGSTRPVKNMDYLLWSDMKIMFEPHVENEVWKLQKGYEVLEWKLYESCGVHSLMMQSMQIYMLVEKKYPLTSPTLSMMMKKKLQIDYESKMA